MLVGYVAHIDVMEDRKTEEEAHYQRQKEGE
jgi:hypothetical protein